MTPPRGIPRPPILETGNRRAQLNDHSRRIYDSMLGLLSNAENPTPLVRLNHVVPFQHTEVYAKPRVVQPFGSVKDCIVEHDPTGTGAGRADRRRSGRANLGNTGLGLIMMGNLLGFDLTTPLSSAIPVEKRRCSGFSAQPSRNWRTTSPGALGTRRSHRPCDGDRREARFPHAQPIPQPSNPDAHYRTTGPEIWRQTEGRSLISWPGWGHAAPSPGQGVFLKEQSSGVQVVGVHPGEGHDIPGVRSIRQLKQTEFFLPDEYDGMIEIGNEDAYALTLRLNREESIPAGPSSGMALAGASPPSLTSPG